MGSRKYSLNLIGPRRGQSLPVFFYNTYRFKNIIHISFYILEIQKIYIEPTLVLTQVYQTWAMHHADTLTTLPDLPSVIQPQWSEISSPHMRPLVQVVHKSP